MMLRLLPSDHILIRIRTVEVKNTCEICGESTAHTLHNGAKTCKRCLRALLDALESFEKEETAE